MKKLILSLVAIATISLSSFGQAPEGFKYQAVLRDAGNIILNNQAVGMKLTLKQGSIGGTAVYTETFSLTTNTYGIVNLEIGTGTTTDNFSIIDWANGPYFIETAADVTGGIAYVVMGTSQLMSVPYALYAKTSGNGAGPQGPQGPAGNNGLDGTDGATGPMGPQGPIGNNGLDGTDGATGPMGPQGPIGNNGLDGTDGATGPIGPQGPAGNNGLDGAIGPQGPIGPAGVSTAKCRWTSFSTFNQYGGSWYANNDPNMFGGIAPSVWSDGNGIAANMSSDKQVLLTLFDKKLYPGNNATIFNNEWYSYSSTNGQFAGALFRIENTTGSDIVWTAEWFSTAYGAWGERSSVTINGVDTWNSGASSFYPNHHESTAIVIPANRVSTIIFMAGSSPASTTRGTYLAFDQNCLSLPVGLKFVDDLDTAPNGWGQ